MTKEELKETIIDYVIDTYSLNKDRDVVANHVDEWLDCREQVNSVDLADVVGRSEQLCDHPLSKRSYIGQNMLRCNKCGKEFS